MDKAGLLIIISAPSGSGKTTMCNKLASILPSVCRSISTTTRPPRRGEKNGRDYIFLSREEFEAEKKQAAFLEWAKVFGHYYGTPRKLVEEARDKGRDIILSIDVQGAQQVKQNYPEAVFIFICPPSRKILEERLRNRRSDREEEISRRLRLAKVEMSQAGNYDYVIVNRNLKDSLHKLSAIIIAEKAKIKRMKGKINGLCFN